MDDGLRKLWFLVFKAKIIREPVPIAQTITYMEEEFDRQKLPKFYTLDSIISVTDALRLTDEFGHGFSPSLFRCKIKKRIRSHVLRSSH